MRQSHSHSPSLYSHLFNAFRKTNIYIYNINIYNRNATYILYIYVAFTSDGQFWIICLPVRHDIGVSHWPKVVICFHRKGSTWCEVQWAVYYLVSAPIQVKGCHCGSWSMQNTTILFCWCLNLPLNRNRKNIQCKLAKYHTHNK